MYFSSTFTLFTQAKTTVPCESRNGLWYNWPRSCIQLRWNKCNAKDTFSLILTKKKQTFSIVNMSDRSTYRADCIWQAAVNNFVRKCTADVAFRSISVRRDFTSSQVHATCNYFIHDKTMNEHLKICLSRSISSMFVLYEAMHVHLISFCMLTQAHTHTFMSQW